MKINALTRKIRRILPLRYCGAVIVAAGNASRMGGIDKIMADLNGMPMIERTVKAFQGSEVIREIVVVTREDLKEEITEICALYDKVTAVVVGGADRQSSVMEGLAALSDSVRLVAVHDGARPLVTWQLIDRTVRAAHTYGAAAPGVSVKDTIKQVKGGVVTKTPDRSTLMAIQTPQVFDRDLLRAALQDAKDQFAKITDDCSAVERMGMSVKVVDGDERNLKITTPNDLKIARILLEDM